MADIVLYLVPLLIFAALVFILKVRPRVLRRRVPITPQRLQSIERDLGPRGRREVGRLLEVPRKIQAIAVVRQRTGASLVEAKALVEAIQRGRERL